MEHSLITLDSLTYTWPDGTAALSGLTGSIARGRTGLIGANGAGKTTLVRLLTGELTPTVGRIHIHGSVGVLPQDLALSDQTIAEVLGIDQVLAALEAVESGDADVAHFDVIGQDWDIAARAFQSLAAAGIPLAEHELDRPMRTLSGGEAVKVGLANLHLHRPELAILDEPTNNLDAAGREHVRGLVDSWRGSLLIISHDRRLLAGVDRIVELYGTGTRNAAGELQASTMRTWEGSFADYRRQLAAEQEAAEQAAVTARSELGKQKRKRIEAQIKLDRRQRTAKQAVKDAKLPPIVSGNRAMEAQKSAAKLTGTHADREAAAYQNLQEAQAQVRPRVVIDIELPDTAVPAGRTVLELDSGEEVFSIRGPERVALAGPNGAGKTTLLNRILTAVRTGEEPGVRVIDEVGVLPQRILLDPQLSVLDTVRLAAPDADPHTVRSQLAGLQLKKDRPDQPVGQLSGGERFRVALAQLLLADPAPQLLLLDEPTNNLDLESIEVLVEALTAYQGALIVVSHDAEFLDEIGCTRTWEITDGALSEARGRPPAHHRGNGATHRGTGKPRGPPAPRRGPGGRRVGRYCLSSSAPSGSSPARR